MKKIILTMLVLVFTFAVTSCRDTEKKTENTMDEAIEALEEAAEYDAIESVEKAAEDDGNQSFPTAIVDVTNPITGKTWMDRNLGATQVATSSTDAASYGDLYQWGRGADGHQLRNSATTTTLSSTDQPGHGDFILTNSEPYDWRSPQNTNLWQGVNGINNPCPIGYRLPTEQEWQAERQSWSSDNAAGAFASQLKLPMAGLRLDSNGSLFLVGTTGNYWSSTVSSAASRYLFFDSGSAIMFTLIRALGLSVRCLKD